jgi:hypothetical protein
MSDPAAQFDAGPPAGPDGSRPPLRPVPESKQAITRRAGNDLFTGATCAVSREHVGRWQVLACFDARYRLATLACILVGLGLIHLGWNLNSSSSTSDQELGMWLIIGGLALPAAPYLHLSRTLHDAARRRWARVRGFRFAHLDMTPLEQRLPLFQLGNHRRLSDAMFGQVAGEQVPLVRYRHSYEKNKAPMLRIASRAEQLEGSWLCVAYQLPEPVAARYVGISVQDRSFPLEDGAQKVKLESSELSLGVFAAPGQDPVALRELLGPQLIAALLQYPVTWEQRGELLVVYTKDDDDDATRDRLCADAAFLLEHYLTEHI